jgi:hypothetical protein
MIVRHMLTSIIAFDADEFFRSRCPPLSSTTPYLVIFLFFQIVPGVLLACEGLSPGLRAFLNFLITIPNFIGCQSILGRTLVGISWRFDFTGPSRVQVIDRSEPEPFLPTRLNSNCFWIGIILSAVVWTVVDLHYFFSIRTNGFLAPLFCLVIAALCDLNCVMFLRIHWRNYRNANDATRSFLLSRTGYFPEVGPSEPAQELVIEPVTEEEEEEEEEEKLSVS